MANRRPDQRSAAGKISQDSPARPTLGFGVPATSDPHHFKVIIPRSNNGRVQISEYLGLQATSRKRRQARTRFTGHLRP